jgi:hypothetical protein
VDDETSPGAEPPRAPALTCRPDRRFTALAGAGVVAALVALALAGDGPSRAMAAVAVAVLLVYVVSDVVFSPRLVASVEGLTVRSPLVRTTLPWAAVEDVRADTRIRLGLRSTTLEIDAGETLIVLSGRAIGGDPAVVAELARSFRPLTR